MSWSIGKAEGEMFEAASPVSSESTRNIPDRFSAGFVEGMGDQEDVVFSTIPPPMDL